MIMKLKTTPGIYGLAAILAVASALAASAPRRVCRGFLPPNEMSIPDTGDKSPRSGITHEQFDAVLDRAEAVYGPIIKARGGNLRIERNWGDATVNASANRSWGGDWVLNMYGGLARHPLMTQDGFALVACHELGHHLGGAPKVGLIFRWASNEGQSDYYANLKCLRRIFADSSTARFTRAEEADPVAEKACRSVYRDPAEQALCLRGSVAAASVSGIFRSLRRQQAPLRFDTPDPSVVRATDNDHPEPQCRLDTYFQGSLCAKPVSQQVDDQDPAAGTCTRSQGFEVGLRPLCWYKPPAEESRSLAEVRLDGLDAARAKISALSEMDGAVLWSGR